jgi:hypothetical protein
MDYVFVKRKIRSIKRSRVPKSFTLFYMILDLLLFGGIGITSEIDFSQFCRWKKDCPDYGIKNQSCGGAPSCKQRACSRLLRRY